MLGRGLHLRTRILCYFIFFPSGLKGLFALVGGYVAGVTACFIQLEHFLRVSCSILVVGH